MHSNYIVRQHFLHITRFIFLWIMSLQVLNLSVDSIDFTPIASANFSEFNDLNTISEYLTEVVLGHSNTFPESSHKEQKQAQLQKHLNVKLYETSTVYTETIALPASLEFEFPLDEHSHYQFCKEINPPPPKYPGNFA